MNKLLSLLTLLFISTNVYAQATVTVTWTNATLNTDGTTLTDLEYTNLYYSICENGDTSATPTVVNVGTVESWTSPILDEGTWCFKATHVNSEAEESDFSNIGQKTVPDTVIPNPPSNLTVQVDDLTAYSISQSDDRFVLIPVGTVPVGTVCDSSMSANGRYLVPRDEVSWAGTYEPPVVFAACS